MNQTATQTKVRATRFECFHVEATWRRGHQAYFYLDLMRDGTKEEQAARKELARLLGQEKRDTASTSWVYHEQVEGKGFNWRVEAAIVAKYAEWLDLPCTIEEELERFDCEGVRRLAESIMVNSLSIHDIEKPHLISLQFSAPYDSLRRALDQYLVTHWQSRDDWMAIDTYGSSIIITREILQDFLDWFTFAKPLEDMLAEAMEAAKVYAEQMKQRQEEAKQWQRTSSQHQHNYREYYRDHQPSYMPPLTPLASALATFSLDASVATKDVIKKRYRTLAKLYHPDAGGSEDAFKKLNNANELLMHHYS